MRTVGGAAPAARALAGGEALGQAAATWTGQRGTRRGAALSFEGIEVALGDGLVLRSAGAADVDRVTDFTARIHGPPDQAGVGEQLGTAVRSLMTGRTPRVGAEDFLVVEDTRDGAVVSSLCVIRQSWRYQGVAFDVDQVEFVGTDPSFRRRGLVRRQMDLVHERSAAEGCLVQVIDGIDWYYRQFGYDYALQASRAGRILAPVAVHARSTVLPTRPATGADADFLAATYRAAMARYQVSVDRDRRRWLADLEGHDPGNYHRPALRVIQDEAGQPIGYCSYWGSFHNPARTPTRLWVGSVELTPDHDWASWGPRVLDCLQDLARTLAMERGLPSLTISVRLGDAHPLYDLGLGEDMDRGNGSIWYVRADVPRFLRLVRPVLEERLAGSPAAGYSGALALSFYREGVRLHFQAGRIVEVEPWTAPDQDEADAWFPDLTFLGVLLGYRSMAEVEDAFPDCGAGDAASRELLEALFPKRPSYTWLMV
jgi:hypothetical protein